MKPLFPLRRIEPTFFAGFIDEPTLLLDMRSGRHQLMFDCGQIHSPANRSMSIMPWQSKLTPAIIVLTV